MLDAVDDAALKFTRNVMERCATPMLQRKFVALGGLDMLINFIRTSVNDEVVSSAAMVLHMLVVTSKGECWSSLHQSSFSCVFNGSHTKSQSITAEHRAVASLLVQLRRTRSTRVLLAVTSLLNDVLASYLACHGPDTTTETLFPYPDEAASLVVGLFNRKVAGEEGDTFSMGSSQTSVSSRKLANELKPRLSNEIARKESANLAASSLPKPEVVSVSISAPPGRDKKKITTSTGTSAPLSSETAFSIEKSAKPYPGQQLQSGIVNCGRSKSEGQVCAGERNVVKARLFNTEASGREEEELDAECAALIFHMCVESGAISSDPSSMAAKLGKAGGVQALLGLCRQCLQGCGGHNKCLESSVLRWTVNALCALLMTEKNHEVFSAEGGPELFIQLLRISSNGQQTVPKSYAENVSWESGMRDWVLWTGSRTRALLHKTIESVQQHYALEGAGKNFMPEFFNDFWQGIADGISKDKETSETSDSHRHDCCAQVLEQVARSLSNFMSSHRSQTIVAGYGGAEVLIQVIRQHIELLTNVEPAAVIDGNSDRSWPTAPPSFGFQDVTDNVKDGSAVQASISDVAVIHQVCSALCNLTFENDSNRIRVGQAGGCEVLVDLCRAYLRLRGSTWSGKYLAVMEQCCAAIGNICKKNRTNRASVGKAGGCEVLVSVIQEAPSEACLIQAVRAVGNVATRSAENQLKLAAADCIRMIVRLIQTFSLRIGSDLTLVKAGEPANVLRSAADGSLQAATCPAAISDLLPFANQSISTLASASSASCSSRGSPVRQSVMHRETLLHLSLSTLLILTEHDCLRVQLQNDATLTSLLCRIVELATLTETQATAKRLLSVIRIYDQTCGGEHTRSTQILDVIERDVNQTDSVDKRNLPDAKDYDASKENQSMMEKIYLDDNEALREFGFEESDPVSLQRNSDAGKEGEVSSVPQSCSNLEEPNRSSDADLRKTGPFTDGEGEHDGIGMNASVVVDHSNDWDSDDYADEVQEGCCERKDMQDTHSSALQEMGGESKRHSQDLSDDNDIEVGDMLDVVTDAFSDSRSVASCRPSSRASSKSGRERLGSQDRGEHHETTSEDQCDCEMYCSYNSVRSEDWRGCERSDDLDAWCSRSNDHTDPSCAQSEKLRDSPHSRLVQKEIDLLETSDTSQQSIEPISWPYSVKVATSSENGLLCSSIDSACLARLALFSDESSSESGSHLPESARSLRTASDGSVDGEEGRNSDIDSGVEKCLTLSATRGLAAASSKVEVSLCSQGVPRICSIEDGNLHSRKESPPCAFLFQHEADATEWSSGDEMGLTELAGKRNSDAINADESTGDGRMTSLHAEDSTVSTQPSGEQSREVVCEQGTGSVWSEDSMSTDVIPTPRQLGLSPPATSRLDDDIQLDFDQDNPE